jgi:hypothetical protein
MIVFAQRERSSFKFVARAEPARSVHFEILHRASPVQDDTRDDARKSHMVCKKMWR